MRDVSGPADHADGQNCDGGAERVRSDSIKRTYRNLGSRGISVGGVRCCSIERHIINNAHITVASDSRVTQVTNGKMFWENRFGNGGREFTSSFRGGFRSFGGSFVRGWWLRYV
jgi:hypothetical protein